MDEATKKVYDGIAKNAIAQALVIRYNWYRQGSSLFSLLSFFSMVYSIVILSSEQMNEGTKANLIIYVILVGLSEFILVLGTILIALSPLICVGLIIFCCCCKGG